MVIQEKLVEAINNKGLFFLSHMEDDEKYYSK